MPAQSVIDGAIQSLTNPGTLGCGQLSDPFLGRVRSNLLQEQVPENDPNQRIYEDYFIDGRDLLWY